MKKEWLVKILALAIVVLFFGVTVTSSIGVSNYLDDTTPPITIISFNPPEPDGENGWYVSDVTVTLNATDADSGVNVTYYRVDYSIWQIYLEPFNLTIDGPHVIKYYSIDNVGNQEEEKSAEICIDQTKPEIWLSYEVKDWDVIFTATAVDGTSGMDRVDFYKNGLFQETVNGYGPTYQWKQLYLLSAKIIGLIRNPEITDENVKFYAIIVRISGRLNHEIINGVFKAVAYDKAGNSDFDDIVPPCFRLINFPFLGIYLFQNLAIPKGYEGFIGKFFIKINYNF